jgi:hypothetical protein
MQHSGIGVLARHRASLAAVVLTLTGLLSEVHEVLGAALGARGDEECLTRDADELRASVQVEGEAATFAGVGRYTGGVHSGSLRRLWLWAGSRGVATPAGPSFYISRSVSVTGCRFNTFSLKYRKFSGGMTCR